MNYLVPMPQKDLCVIVIVINISNMEMSVGCQYLKQSACRCNADVHFMLALPLIFQPIDHVFLKS